MEIRRALPGDHDVLVDIWLRSVRATHDFLTEENIEHLHQLVRNGALEGLEIWVVCGDADTPLGFMGLSGANVEALFLDPQIHRQGCGRRLLQHARELKGQLTVDVNEQNPAAVRFYEACGFVVEGRSPLDSIGLAFPILHMRQRNVDSPGNPERPADGTEVSDKDYLRNKLRQTETGNSQ